MTSPSYSAATLSRRLSSRSTSRIRFSPEARPRLLLRRAPPSHPVRPVRGGRRGRRSRSVPVRPALSAPAPRHARGPYPRAGARFFSRMPSISLLPCTRQGGTFLVCIVPAARRSGRAPRCPFSSVKIRICSPAACSLERFAPLDDLLWPRVSSACSACSASSFRSSSACAASASRPAFRAAICSSASRRELLLAPLRLLRCGKALRQVVTPEGPDRLRLPQRTHFSLHALDTGHIGRVFVPYLLEPAGKAFKFGCFRFELAFHALYFTAALEQAPPLAAEPPSGFRRR